MLTDDSTSEKAPRLAFWQRWWKDPATGFGIALYVALALNLVQGVWLMRLLEPADYGRWLEIFLIFVYGQHFHLGIQNSVLRQLPLLRGQGDRSRARELAGAAHGGLVVLSFGWIVFGAVAVRLFYREAPELAAVAVGVTVLEAWSALAVAELKTAHRFLRVGALSILRSALNLGLLVLVARYQLTGAYLRWALLLAVMTVAWWMANPVRVRWRWSVEDLRFLLRDGGPILLVGVLFSLQVSMDKTLIKVYLDAEAMGRYGAAAILMTLMLVIPTSIGQTAYPRMLEEFGRGVSAQKLFGDTLRRCAAVAGLSAVVATIGGLVMPAAVGWILPRYSVGVEAAQWLLPGTVFLAASVPASYFLQTIRRQGVHALVSGVGVLCQITLGAAVLHGGADIEELAMTTSASLLIYFLMILAAARWTSVRTAPISQPASPAL